MTIMIIISSVCIENNSIVGILVFKMKFHGFFFLKQQVQICHHGGRKNVLHLSQFYRVRFDKILTSVACKRLCVTCDAVLTCGHAAVCLHFLFFF